MGDLPEPLVSPDVDVRDLDGFMLNVERLMASELVALATAEEFRAAVFLWCRAWKQVPAASLPNNERVLAGFSGAGTRWSKIREMAMHGFVLCSDDRFYHPVLSQEALRAFERKQLFRDKKTRDAQRLKNWRDTRTADDAGWEGLRQAAFDRDDRKCLTCGSIDDLHCDHIRPLRYGGDNDMANLQTLCRSCHGKKMATERHRYARETRTDGTSHASDMQFVAEGQGQGQGQGESKKEDSEAIASAAEAPPDPTRELWDRGKNLLGPNKGALLGKMRKEHGDVAVLEAIVKCEEEQPSEPAGFLIACLARASPKSGNGKHPGTYRPGPVAALFEGAHNAAEAYIKRHGLDQADICPDIPNARPLLDRK